MTKEELGAVTAEATCNTGCGGQKQATKQVEMEATGCGEGEEYVTGCGRLTWDVTQGSNAMPGTGYVRPGTTSTGAVADTRGGGQALTGEQNSEEREKQRYRKAIKPTQPASPRGGGGLSVAHEGATEDDVDMGVYVGYHPSSLKCLAPSQKVAVPVGNQKPRRKT